MAFSSSFRLSPFLYSSLIAILTLSSPIYASFWYPNPLVSSLERLLVDTDGNHASPFTIAIKPCTNYISGAQTIGRETAAQWIRVAYHDFVTANVTAGTGGMDASIGFETLREENSGTAFNDSFTWFRPFVDAQVSMADLIALSNVLSAGNCGNVRIPLRGGRLDATGPGITGVPAPDTSLELTLAYHARAGFNQVDTIALTACGHTMGRVHSTGFPTVVESSAISPNNTAGGVNLDSTPALFDTDVVHEYIDGTGQKGGPLVTSFNVSSRSDLRLYTSDANATMWKLYRQGEGFLDTCVGLFQRMLETVPKEVTLSETIEPLGVKPVNASLDLTEEGELLFVGSIRILTPSGTSPPQSLTLSIPGLKPTSLTPEPETGSSIFGTSTYYPFSIPLSSLSNPSIFTQFTVSAGRDITPQTFTTQAQAFLVPSLSSASNGTSGSSVKITVATLKSSGSGYGNSRARRSTDESDTRAPSVNVLSPVPQQGTLAPKIQSYAVTLSKGKTLGKYQLWEGGGGIESVVTGGVTVEVVSGGEVVDRSLLLV